MIDLTPKYAIIPAKDKLIIPDLPDVFGASLGGLQAGATSVQQGSGNDVFKISEKGIHLGAAEFADAPFSVSMAGVITGLSLTVSTLDIGGNDASSFHVDIDGNMWLGATSFASAPTKINSAGVATITSGTIGGFTLSSTALTASNLILDSSGQRISLGSSNDIVILDADDATYRLWVGHATAASAPFSVSKAGAVVASSITITGATITSSTVNNSELTFNDSFGDGSDGDVTISANTTLTRDMYYNNLTIDSTKILTTAGYRIFVKGTLTNNGTISNSGSDAVAGAAGAAGAAGYYNGGNDGGSSDNNGGNAGNPSLGGAGGAGGGGGTGGTVTAPSATLGGFRHYIAAVTMRSTTTAGTHSAISGGAGGGGGLTSGSAGGGGGGGGGVLMVAAKIIDNSSGIIKSNGGDGADGVGGDAGGGGGGGGGVVVIIYNSLTLGTETASGGTKGLKSGAGADGVDGSAGLVLKLPI